MDIQIPPGFEADIRKVQQLEEQKQRDPPATADLIQLYERMLGRLQVNENPLFYAALQYSLGEAYSDLPTGDRASNLAQAIRCYQQALRFYTPETVTSEYAALQYSLGNAYWRLWTGERATNLALAIAYFQEALRFWTPETALLAYVATQGNLGTAYRDLPTGDRAANLQQAIAFLQEALRFYTPEAAPLDYAVTQADLGLAYYYTLTGDRAANLRQAIACYQEALRFYTLEIAPFECRWTNSSLAELYFTQGEWQAALDAYRAAMDAGEQLYRSGLSVESKATEVATNTTLYRNAAYSAVRCGQVADALLILEQGKTRLLAEALRLGVVRPANIPDEMWIEFKSAGVAVRAAQAGSTDSVTSQERDPVQSYRVREQAARDAHAALEAAIEHIRVYVPDFLHLIDLPTIQGLLPDERTVLVTFSITDQGSIGFVVRQNHDQFVQVVELPTFTKAELDRLIIERDADGRAVGGWLGAYRIYQTGPTETTLNAWQATITSALAELGQSLLAPVLSGLPLDVERIILLPSAELFLLPIHAVPLPHTISDRLCDRFQVSYAPSIDVLSNIRANARQSIEPELYAVINPQSDPQLAFTEMEGAAIARLFARRSVDEGPVGTKQRVIAAASGRSYVHFSCHGSYNWNDPTQSGLELADERLTLAELQQATIDLSAARLVTLSACETGISDVLKGSPEEYVGIPAGFIVAGVPCVVSSLWAVPDLSTALLMERFYRNHVQDGMEFTTALREAQRWIRQATAVEMKLAETWEGIYQSSGERNEDAFRWMRYYRIHPEVQPFAHPYCWAAFTVNGM